MSFGRILYIIGKGPILIRLSMEIWFILTEATEERLNLYLEGMHELAKRIRGSSREEKQKIASDISDIVRRL